MFSKGERVLVNGSYDGISFFADPGVIISHEINSNDEVCIEFVRNIDGHDGEELRGKAYHCWWVPTHMCQTARPPEKAKREGCPRLKERREGWD